MTSEVIVRQGLFTKAGPRRSHAGNGPSPGVRVRLGVGAIRARGEVDFSVDRSELRTARAGDLVHVPAGTPHWFRWNRGGGAMLSIASRLGASHLFVEIDREIASDKPDVEKLIAIALRNGLAVVN